MLSLVHPEQVTYEDDQIVGASACNSEARHGQESVVPGVLKDFCAKDVSICAAGVTSLPGIDLCILWSDIFRATAASTPEIGL